MTNTQSPAPGVAANQASILKAFIAEGLPIDSLASHIDAAEDQIRRLQASAAAVEPVAWKWEVLPGTEQYKRKGNKEGVYLEDPAALGIPMDHPSYRWTKLYTASPLPAQVQAAEVTFEDWFSVQSKMHIADPKTIAYNAWHAALKASRTPAPGMAGGVGAERELDLYDEIECDLPYLFGRASAEGHDSGQRLAAQVKAKMQRARAAAPHPSPAPQAAVAEKDAEGLDVAAIMEKIPTVARLYYTGLATRRYRRASTMAGPGEPLVHRSHVERELNLIAAIRAGKKG